MADLEPLIRYRKHVVDEKQKFLSQLYREAEQLEQQKKVIEDRMAKEIALAEEMNNVEAQAYLGRFLEGSRRKVKALERSIEKMEIRIDAAREDMRTAFAEMKKIEIVKQNRDDQEEAALKAKEDLELDEIALEGYRRRLNEAMDED